MRAVVQRVTESEVTVEGKVTGAIKQGLMILLGVEEGDTETDANYLADKIAGLRIFEDEQERMNLSVQDVNGAILAVSQFTLLGDVRKGKRPSFSKAAKSENAKVLYEAFIEKIKTHHIKVEEGIFQAEMLVKIHNDGPVTILLDSKKIF